MQCMEEHIETAAEGQDSESSTEEEFCPFEERTRLELEEEEQANNEQEPENTTMDSDETDHNDSEEDDILVRVGEVEYPIIAKRRRTGEQNVATAAVGAVAYLSTYCSVLAVHQQYSHFLKCYKMKSIVSWWYCIV